VWPYRAMRYLRAGQHSCLIRAASADRLPTGHRHTGENGAHPMVADRWIGTDPQTLWHWAMYSRAHVSGLL
ncbi:MAG: hypothetical protein AAGF32_08245, partial [Pseudomonadota bacterium]